MTQLEAYEVALFESAVREAALGLAQGGVPVGAALGSTAGIVAVGRNERVQRGDPIAHGEMSCLRNAGRRRSYGGMTLCTTLSPCEMCAGAIGFFGIARLIVGEATTFAGNLDRLRERGVAVVVLDDDRCVEMMRRFQRDFPDVWAEDIAS